MTDILQPSPATGSSTQSLAQPTSQPEPARSDANGSASTWPAGIPKHMTWEEYLAWDFGEYRAEWVDGEVVLMPPVRAEHQFIVQLLYELLIGFVRPRKLGRILLNEMLMRLTSRPSGREPDLMFFKTEHEDRLKDTFFDGPADIVVEVVSPESEQRDRAVKYLEYEAGGVPEYWFVDPLRKEAYFYLLGEDGRYHLAPTASDGIFRSRTLEGFRLKVDWLWRAATLDPNEALAELAD
jgi:Uma2 family endonuclease